MKIVCIIVLLTVGTAMGDDDTVIDTSSGQVRGTLTKSFTGKAVEVFYGIPYAKPPLEELRFGPPVEVEPWTGVFNATKPSLACYQRIIDQMVFKSRKISWMPMRPWTEDCLKLHIWVPKPRPEKAAVMVYIHGGGFSGGDPTHIFISGATLAAEENVIVVSMNYRLHVLGFAYLGIPEAPGNAGLMDQQLALQWVSKNIASFGGDPSAVTLFGLSAGGASVGYHILAPSSRALFQRAILMSGAPLCPWGIVSKEKALERTMAVAEAFDCVSEDKKQVLECLNSVHPEHFLDYLSGPASFNDKRHFAPILDGEFLAEDQSDLSNSVGEQKLSVMVGLTGDEAGIFLLMLYPHLFTEKDGQLTPSKFQSGILSTFDDHSETVRKMLSFLYTNWTHPEDPYELRDGFKDLIADTEMNCPVQEFSHMLASTGMSVYRYVSNYRTNFLPLPDWMGAIHGSDAILHMGMAAGQSGNWTTEENALSRIVMKWWGNFARKGDPNSEDMSTPHWPSWTSQRQEYMDINFDSVVLKDFRIEECQALKTVMSSTKDKYFFFPESSRHCP